MTVQTLKESNIPAADTMDKFHGNQILYIGWDQHLLFCAPFAYCLPPSTRFGDVVEQNLAFSYSRHPDWAKIDWSKVEWLKSGKPWQPDMNKTLGELGLKHKDALRFRTPGLNGIAGCGA